MTIRSLSLLSLSLAFAFACSGGGSTSSTTPPPPPPPPEATPAPADGSIGVTECDEYIKKMEACIASADPVAKPAMESSFKTTKDAWVQAAATPQGKATLAASCQAMLSSIPTNCGSGTGSATPAAGTDPAAAGGTPAAGAAPATGTAATDPAAGTDQKKTTDAAATGTTSSGTSSTSTTEHKTTTREENDGPKASMHRTRADARPASGDHDGTRKSGSGTSSGDKGSDGMKRHR